VDQVTTLIKLVYIYCNKSCSLLYLGWFGDAFDSFSIVFCVRVIDDDDHSYHSIIKL
jgi:hypothetical protein